jgi:hypothetical protein
VYKKEIGFNALILKILGCHEYLTKQRGKEYLTPGTVWRALKNIF